MSDVLSSAARRRLESLSCQAVFHPYTDSCFGAYWTIVKSVIRFSLPLYTSLHLLPALLRRKSWRKLYEEVLPNIFWSTLFLTGYGSTFMLSACLCRNAFGGHYIWNTTLLPGLLASLSLLAERSGRRAELAVYMLNQMLFSCWQLVRRRTRLYVPFGDVVVFCLTMALLATAAEAQPNAVRGLAGAVLRYNLSDPSTWWPTGRNLLDQHIPGPIAAACRGFAFGWGMKAALSLVSTLFRGRWRAVLSVPLDRASLRMGMVIGSMAGLYHALKAHLARGKAVSLRTTFVAAAVAALPYAANRSLPVVCYFAAKALEALFFVLCHKVRVRGCCLVCNRFSVKAWRKKLKMKKHVEKQINGHALNYYSSHRKNPHPSSTYQNHRAI